MNGHDPETMLRAFEDVEEVVGLGRYHDSPEAIERLLALPRGLTPTTRAEIPLYRVYALDAPGYADVIDRGLRIDHAPVTSWTRSRTAARMILRGMLGRPGTHRVVIIAKTVPSKHLLVDVPELYRRLGFDDECVESWDLYARWEQEVFLENLPPLDLRQEDVLETGNPEDPEAYRPLIGERIWVETAESMDVIHGITGIRKRLKDREHWRVTTETGRAGLAYYDHRHHSWNLRHTKT